MFNKEIDVGKGKFLVLEGGDGSGKTTQAKLLAEELKRRGGRILLTAEHTRSSIGLLIEKRLRHEVGDIDPIALQILFVADRVNHVNGQIEPAISRGETVLCDRYWASTAVYGGAVIDMDLLIEINRRLVRDPDETVLIDVPVEVAMERLGLRGEGKTIFEKRDFLEGVRVRYLELAKRFDWIVVDGQPGSEVVCGNVVRELETREMVKWV